MKLVRKNDEFIVIESNGSYHKVLLSEIDELIVLLCEAKQIDPAKANKSVGENLFAEQERVTKLFTPHVEALHRDYERARAVMGMSLADIKEKIAARHPVPDDIDVLSFGQKYFDLPSDLLSDNHFNVHQWIPPLANEFAGPRISMTGRPDMTMNIVKGREKLIVDMESSSDFGPAFVLPLDHSGFSVNFTLPEIPEEYLRAHYAKDKKDN